GAFALVLELIPASLSRRITDALTIPTIGIGAGPECDGQVLVTQDMLGMFEDFRPRFVRRYAELGAIIRDAVGRYIEDVTAGCFPGLEHSVVDGSAGDGGGAGGSSRSADGPEAGASER